MALLLLVSALVLIIACEINLVCENKIFTNVFKNPTGSERFQNGFIATTGKNFPNGVTGKPGHKDDEILRRQMIAFFDTKFKEPWYCASMSQNVCRRQFTCRALGFACSEAEKESFYKSQWGENRIVFMIYRLLVWMYSFGWTLAYLINLRVNHHDEFKVSYTFLTNWGDVMNTIYFTLAVILSIVGVVNRRKMIFTDSLPTKILRSAMWIFFTGASTAQTLIPVTYWVTLAPIAPPEAVATAFNIHRHAINAFLIFLDLWIAAFPIRLLHFIYAVVVAAVYVLMTVIEHFTDGISAIYPFLNWETNPGLAAGISVAFAVLGPIVCQSIWFGFYNLRILFDKVCCSRRFENTRLRSRSNDYGGQNYDIENPAFNPVE